MLQDIDRLSRRSSCSLVKGSFELTEKCLPPLWYLSEVGQRPVSGPLLQRGVRGEVQIGLTCLLRQELDLGGARLGRSLWRRQILAAIPRN